MGVNFVARKCTQCAGRLEYDKEKKVWRCIYCGAEIERQEQYDGLFTIKNVAVQSLRDTAYRRLESAEKNIVECEKIDARYCGTLIAQIACEMITMTTPGACPQAGLRNLMAQLKKNYDLLCKDDHKISEEELAFYEDAEDADVYATLILVFDSLNDTDRRDMALQFLNVEEIYSAEANNNLLTYALRHDQTELADKILNNIDNLDVNRALQQILEKYPDGTSKGRHIADCIDTGNLGRDSQQLIEKYVSESEDSRDTKITVIQSAVAGGIEIRLEFVVGKILTGASPQQVRDVLQAFCKHSLSDADLNRIVSFACSCGSYESAEAALQSLKQSEQYVPVSAKCLIALLSSESFQTEDKLKLLKMLYEFHVEQKTSESVLNDYLCYNQSNPEERKELIPFLLEQTENIPSSTVQNYVLKCSQDGENKPWVVETVFGREINSSLYKNLLDRYLTSSQDEQSIRDKVVKILSGSGLSMTSEALTDYACQPGDDSETKVMFVRRMLENGSQLRSDGACRYLEDGDPDQFNSDLFAALLQPGSTFSAKAVENYLLYCRDRETVKAENFATIVQRCPDGANGIRCRIQYGDDSLDCSLLQAYILLSRDSQPLTHQIVDWLINSEKMKINAELTCSGKNMKFKKYVVSNRANLSETADTICQQYRVYSMIF